MRMINFSKYSRIMISLLLVLSILGLIACTATPTPTPSPTPSPTLTPSPSPSPSPTSGTEEVTIDLSAENLAFDKNSITVRAGAQVTINFDNLDSVGHNFALYESPSATNSIFIGEIVTGPETITYEFMAPSEPGTYFFRCDVHPTSMTGEFIVEED